MKVALGTIEVPDETLKAVRKEKGQSGRAKRDEMREYLLDHVNDAIANAGPKQVSMSAPADTGDTLPEPPTDASTATPATYTPPTA